MAFNRIIPLLILAFPQTSFAWTSWVGVLEDWPIQNEVKSDSKPDAKSEAKYEARVRPLFVRIDQKEWQAAPRPGDTAPVAQLPKAFSWDVCFSGRAEGQLTAMLIADGMPTTTPPYLLRAEDRAPWRTRRSGDYAGWLSTPVYKPILLMSSLNTSCKDPEKWKQSGTEKIRPQLNAMIAELRKKLESSAPGSSSYEFSEKDLKIYKTWGSPKNGVYAAIQTKSKPRVVETFHISSTSDIAYLGRDMMLVDAGDFDGDGYSEVLFKRRGDKKDVYELYSKGKQVAESIWDYP